MKLLRVFYQITSLFSSCLQYMKHQEVDLTLLMTWLLWVMMLVMS
jgi:hypothetical protein